MVGLAVLADERRNWRPDTYRQGRWGCEVVYRYPVAKLADWRARRHELEESENPFATVILAHLAAQETRGNMAARERTKLQRIARARFGSVPDTLERRLEGLDEEMLNALIVRAATVPSADQL